MVGDKLLRTNYPKDPVINLTDQKMEYQTYLDPYDPTDEENLEPMTVEERK